MRSTCRRCHGQRRIILDKCRACSGRGETMHRKTISVPVPAGNIFKTLLSRALRCIGVKIFHYECRGSQNQTLSWLFKVSRMDRLFECRSETRKFSSLLKWVFRYFSRPLRLKTKNRITQFWWCHSLNSYHFATPVSNYCMSALKFSVL